MDLQQMITFSLAIGDPDDENLNDLLVQGYQLFIFEISQHGAKNMVPCSAEHSASIEAEQSHARASWESCMYSVLTRALEACFIRRFSLVGSFETGRESQEKQKLWQVYLELSVSGYMFFYKPDIQCSCSSNSKHKQKCRYA